MTDQSSPITPPPELRAQWKNKAPHYRDCGVGRDEWIMYRAAQWGADQELEACYCEVSFRGSKGMAEGLQAARRPKPPSLKEQALAIVTRANQVLASEEQKLLRRALESLDG